MATASNTKKGTVSSARKPVLVQAAGRFGPWGGRYVPETLMAAVEELEREYERAKKDRRLKGRLKELLRTYAGRPTPLLFGRRRMRRRAGAQIYFRREN